MAEPSLEEYKAKALADVRTKMQRAGQWLDENLRYYGGPHLYAALMGSKPGELGEGQPARGGLLSGVAEMSPGADMRDMLEGSGQLMQGQALEGAALMGGALLGTMVPGSVGGLRKAAEAAAEPTIKAYHGSPHDFDRFSLDKIGTGEGAQAYGHGLYFAENEGVAREYRRQLSGPASVKMFGQNFEQTWPMELERLARAGEITGPSKQRIDRAIRSATIAGRDPVEQLRGIQEHAMREMKRNNEPQWSIDYQEAAHKSEMAFMERAAPEIQHAGRMYEVAIKADPESFLDWDKPLSEQSEAVRDAINRVARDPRFALDSVSDSARGVEIKSLLNNPDATQELRRLGVSGIRYLDQGSRSAGEGSRNFVVFDDATIEILRKYGILAPVAGGAAALSLGQSSEAQAANGGPKVANQSLEAYKKQRMAEIQAKLQAAQKTKIDYTTGAPANVRALVGSAQTPRDRLATLQKYYPDAQPVPGETENYVFTNPETGVQTLYNPQGLDTGDAPSLTREVVGQMGGAAAGAAYGGSRAGAPGAVVGGMLGALGGDEAVTLGARALGMEDTRTGAERLQDAATLAAGEGLGHMGGAALTKGVTGLAKSVFRGGETGRRGVQQSIEDASRFDSFPSVAQATQKAYLDGIESTLAKVPGGAGHIRSAVKETTDKVAKQLEGKVQALTGRSEVDPEIAGRAVISGVGEMPSGGKAGTGFLGRFGETKSALYAKADGLIPDSTLVTPLNTRAALNELGNVVEDLPELNEWLVSKGIKGLAGAFPAQGPINYETLRRIRTAVGNKLTNFDLVSDVSRADWKRLYGALSEDLKLAAQNAGPGATQAMNRADAYYKAGIKRVDEVLEPLVKKRVPELISAALSRSVEKGGSTIRTVMRSLSPEERQVVSGSIVKNLGSARPGQQGAAGEAFSFETFLTNWNKLDPKAKEALFDWPGMKGMKEDLEALARWSEGMRESSQAFANPSGTSGSTGAMLGSLSVGAGATGAIFGSTEMLAFPAVMAVSALGANAGARLMTSKPFVRWLAQSTKIKPSGWGAHIGRLAGIAAASQEPGAQQAIIDFMTALNQGEANGN